MQRPKGPSKRFTRPIRIVIGGHVWMTWWMSCCGVGALSPCRPDGTQGESVVPRRYCWRCGVKRPDKAAHGGLPSLEPRVDSITLSRFPTLEDLLCDPNWDDTSPKGKRCLFLFLDDTSVRLLLKLEADCLKFSCVARDLDDVLMTAEQLLKTGNVVWEQDSPPPQRSRQKKK